MLTVYKYFLWLILYSFIGWAYETTLCSIEAKKFINRGFLNGPLCPVYGFGALIVLVFLYGVSDDILTLFVLGMILTCTVEYLTSYLLEKAFSARWWDYSKHRFNLNGRICLLGAVVFGSFAVLLVKYIHPFVEGITASIPDPVLTVASLVLFALLSLDFSITVKSVLILNGRLKEIQQAINAFMVVPLKQAEDIRHKIYDSFEASKFNTERIKALLAIKNLQHKRLMMAFPKLKSVKYNDALQKIRAWLFPDNEK